MHEHPSVQELSRGIDAFESRLQGQNLTGHEVFLARIATNARDLITRDQAMRPHGEDIEARLLNQALGKSGDIGALNRELCQAIRFGSLAADDPALLSALRIVTTLQVQIDQPDYSGLKDYA